MRTSSTEHDIIVAGGGISGVALAYGLAAQGRRVSVLDAPTPINTASRTNVGLIWCQSKFLHLPDYARWGFESARLFPALTAELQEVSDLPVAVNYSGGLIPCLSEEEYAKRESYLQQLQQTLGDYPGQMIDRAALERKLPRIHWGKDVCGAAWCEADGLIDPLALLRAFQVALPRVGVRCVRTVMHDIQPLPGKAGYRVSTDSGFHDCEYLVLAAGLANRRFARFAIPDLPVHADKGQVLLVERLPMVMPIPVLGVTQTFGGTVVIGFRHERAGHDTQVHSASVAQEGLWAMRVWPALAQKRIIRTWSGLRVMPNDSQAIYSHLPGHPKVTLCNTHSAVTMAAVHTRLLPDYLLGGALPPLARSMTLQRFGYSC